jgi:acyl carrier protein
MASIKSVLLRKTRTDDGCVAEFYNPFWGSFVVDCKYDADAPHFNNMINLMRVGDYYMVSGKSNKESPDVIREFSVIKYLSRETEAARKSKRELNIPNMSVREIDKLADDTLTRLTYAPYQKELNQIYSIIKDKFYITSASPNTSFVKDLQFDSLDFAELLMFLEAELKLPVSSLDFSESISEYMTVGGLAKKAKRVSQRPQQAPVVKQQLVEEKKNLWDMLKQKFREFIK